MPTQELIRWLRNFSKMFKDKSTIMVAFSQAADRLEELEERVAIMSESKEPIRCYECAWFEPENAEEGCTSGHCRKRYAPCENELVDMTFYCGYAEPKEENDEAD